LGLDNEKGEGLKIKEERKLGR